MKRILYFYGTLLLTLAQAFIWFVALWITIDNLAYDGIIDSSEVILIVLFALFILLTVHFDSKIRGYKEWYMIVLAFLVSPIRFILQIITIVMYHVGGNSEKFCQKGDYTHDFSSWTMYVLFGTDNLKGEGSYYSSYRPRSVKKTPKTKVKKATPTVASTTSSSIYPQKPDGTLDSHAITVQRSIQFDAKRYNHIQKLKGNLQKATLFIFGFVKWKEGWQSFEKYDLGPKYHKTANITHVWVDGVDFVCDAVWNDDGHGIRGAAKLYLPKGTYNIQVRYQIVIPETDFPGIGAGNKKMTNVGQTDSITVTITDEGTPKFIGIFSSISCSFDTYKESNGVKVVKNLKWNMDSTSVLMTREKCKSYWNDNSNFEYLVGGAACDLSF